MISGVIFCKTLKNIGESLCLLQGSTSLKHKEIQWFLIVSGLAPALPIPQKSEKIYFQHFVAVATVLSHCSEYSIIVSGHDY